MNEDQIKGQWKQFKGKVKERWGRLTDDDVDRMEGQAEEAVGILQERYGYERDDAKQEWEKFCKSC